MYGEWNNGREDRDAGADTFNGMRAVMGKELARVMWVCCRKWSCLAECTSGGVGVSGGQVWRNGLETALGGNRIF